MSWLSRFAVLLVASVCLAGCSHETKSNTVTTMPPPAGTPNAPAVPANAAGAAGLVMGGFESTPPVDPVANNFTPTAAPAPSAPAPPAPATGAPQPGFAGQPGIPSSPAGGSDFVPAQAGVGIKGRSLDPHEGIIVTPAKTLFTARERIVFEIAIPQSLNLYKASNGQAPATHDEFMQKIVLEQNIQLPQLPAGHRYVYDPQTEQLLVERPKK